MATAQLISFSSIEEAMILEALQELERAGYDTELFKVFIRVEMPGQYRAMTLDDGAALGDAAFSSQRMINHVLEEELLHLRQKAAGQASEFGARTARALEAEIDEQRKFSLPS
jgi:hypothetical protein